MKAKHLLRYTDIGRLLLKHRRANVAGQDLLDGDIDASSDAGSIQQDAEALASDLEAMGPTFVKLGQLLSTRADVLPQIYLKALSRLQDDVEPVPFDEIERVVTSELGVRISRGGQSSSRVRRLPRRSARFTGHCFETGARLP